MDNDREKQGKLFAGKRVYAPGILRTRSYQTILASMYSASMRRQLDEMGLEGTYVTFSRFLADALESEAVKLEKLLPDEGVVMQNEEMTFIFDALLGVGWGGTETWACRAAQGLRSRGHAVLVFGGKQRSVPAELGGVMRQFDLSKPMREWMREMLREMAGRLPLCFVNNFSSSGLLAAAMLKRAYPEQVRIVSVVHNDLEGLHEQHMGWAKQLDVVLCVSETIRQRLLETYRFPADCVYARPNPVSVEAHFEKAFSAADQPLRIGWAARMEREQKRADLFPALLAALEKARVPYRLELAGDGPYEPLLKAYVIANGLAENVLFRGVLNEEEMCAFWKRQDVYLNFSDYEGMSLAMLEAMSWGCVPVATDVSGARELLRHRANGWLCPAGEISAVAEGLTFLARRREKLPRWGAAARQTVREACDMQRYLDFLEKLLLGG